MADTKDTAPASTPAPAATTAGDKDVGKTVTSTAATAAPEKKDEAPLSGRAKLEHDIKKECDALTVSQLDSVLQYARSQVGR